MSSIVSGSHECKLLSLYETNVLYLGNKSEFERHLLDVGIQEDVIDEDLVAVVDTETQIAELNALGHALGEQRGGNFVLSDTLSFCLLPAFTSLPQEIPHLVNVLTLPASKGR